MAMVGSIGVGVFLLAFFWGLGLGVILLFMKTPNAGAIGVAVILALGVFTLILVLIPREDGVDDGQADIKEHDNLEIGRAVLLIVVSLFAAVGLVLVFVMDCMRPVLAPSAHAASKQKPT
eukprot:m.33165 g.33165  ORF g.33165 m.33165 type:complete len:120 (+) comp10303_c0_seq1:586-945(+)